MIPTTTVANLNLRTRLAIRDGGQTFLDTEIADSVQKAIEEEIVFSIIETTLALTGARQYAIDPSYTGIFNVACDVDGDGFPETDVPGDAYDLVNANLIITPAWKNLTGTLFIQVGKKWTITDAIPEYFSNFIINAGVFRLGELLSNSYESRFLNNDVTMAELLDRCTQGGREMERLRKGLRNQKVVRL